MKSCITRIKIIRIVSYCIGAFFLIFALLLHLSQQKASLAHYAFNALVGALYFGAGCLGILLYRMETKFNQKLFFLMSALAMISWSIGSAIWSYFNFIERVEIPYPSVGDIFFIGYNLFFGLAYWFLINSVRLHINKKTLRESLILVMGIYLIVFYVFYRPSYARDLSLVEITVNMLYPLVDSFVIAVSAVVLRLSRGGLQIGALYLTMSFIIQVTADILFTYRTARGIYWNGDVSDVLFLMSALFVVWGLLQVRTSEFTE